MEATIADAVQQAVNHSLQQFQAERLQMVQEIQKLTTAVTDQQAVINRLQTEAAAAAASSSSGSKPAAKAHSKDWPKILKDLEKYGESDGKLSFVEWAYLFRQHVGRDPQYRVLLASSEAATTMSECLNANLNAEHKDLSSELFYILTLKVRGASLDLVVNMGEGEGCAGWRNLVHRSDPRSTLRFTGGIMSLIDYDFSGSFLSKLETFEKEVRRVETKSGEKVTDSLKVGIVMKRMPESKLREQLILNADRWREWDTFKKEVVRMSETYHAAIHDGSGPMEVDVFGKGSGKKGKQKSSVTCYNCKRTGHTKAECRLPGGGAHDPSRSSNKGASKGSDKGKKGGKKGDENPGLKNVKCYKCGRKGHIAAKCHAKPLRALEEESDPTAASSSGGAVDLEAGALFLNAFDLQGFDTTDVRALKVELGFSDSQISALDQLGFVGPSRSTRSSSSTGGSSGETIRWGIDSCAAVTVVPKATAKAYPLHVDSLAGRSYKPAGGAPIYDEGSKILYGSFGGAKAKRAIRTRVADVSRPLFAVSELCDTEQSAFYSKGHSCILDKAGTRAVLACVKQQANRIEMVRRNGVYEVDMMLENCSDPFHKKLLDASKQRFHQ